MISLKALSLAAMTLVSHVAAHGTITGYTVNDGDFIQNYHPHFWREDMRITPGWTTDNKDYGFVKPSTYANGDIICHRKATPGALVLKVKAGDIIHLQWSHWVPTHHGPMMHYMAHVDGEHKNIDKFKLKWNKIDQLGLIDPLHAWNTSAAQPAGYWAADRLIVQGGRWDFQIPKKVAKGNYVLRAETIAVHSSMIKDGSQHYPQCINLEVTEGGDDSLLGGVVGTELYSPTDPGIGDFNVFSTKPIYSNYPIPGPPIHECGQKGYDQTPRPGSAPKWLGPQSAQPFGTDRQGNRVGPVGVDPPNGPTYGSSNPDNAVVSEYQSQTPPSTTTSSSATTTSVMPDSMITSATPLAATTSAVTHSSFSSHKYEMSANGTNPTATGIFPTGTASPTIIANPDGNTPYTGGNHQGSGNQNSGSHQNSGNHQNPGSNQNSGNQNSGNQNSGNQNSGNHNSGNHNSDNQNSGNHNSGNQNSQTGGDHYNSGTNNHHSTSGNQNSHKGGNNHLSSGTKTANQGTASKSTDHKYVDNSPGGTTSNSNGHHSSSGNQLNSATDSCPEPAKVNSALTPTDDSTVSQLLDIIDTCVQRLKGKLSNKLRRHARDVLRRSVGSAFVV